MMASTPSSPLNCSLALPPTPAPSLTCLNQDMPTASPSCLGGGTLSVGEEAMTTTTLTRAYPGLQETEAGHKFSPLGTTDNFFIIIKIHINSVKTYSHVAWTLLFIRRAIRIGFSIRNGFG